MRSLIFSALGTLRIGMETLRKENVRIDRLYGHGGFFKTKEVGQRYAAAALEAPDRKSTRLNSSHLVISYAVFCLKKKNPSTS